MMSYPIEYGLDNQLSVSEGCLVISLVLAQRSDKEFELDGWSPEVVTANQRACEVRVQD